MALVVDVTVVPNGNVEMAFPIEQIIIVNVKPDAKKGDVLSDYRVSIKRKGELPGELGPEEVFEVSNVPREDSLVTIVQILDRYLKGKEVQSIQDDFESINRDDFEYFPKLKKSTDAIVLAKTVVAALKNPNLYMSADFQYEQTGGGMGKITLEYPL